MQRGGAAPKLGWKREILSIRRIDHQKFDTIVVQLLVLSHTATPGVPPSIQVTNTLPSHCLAVLSSLAPEAPSARAARGTV